MTSPTLDNAPVSDRPLDWLIDVLRGDDDAVHVSRGEAPAGHVELERYTVFPTDADPRLLITASSWRVRAAALRRVGTQTGTTMRLVRRIGAELARTGLDQVTAGADVVLSTHASRVAEAPGDRPALTLVEHLEQQLDVPGLHVAVTMGPLRPNRKPVLQVMDADGTLLAYAKIGWDAATRDMVDREASVLDRLAGLRLRSVRVPATLHHGSWRDRAVLVTSPLDHPEAGVAPDALTMAALVEIATVEGTRTGALGASPWWISTRRRAERCDAAGVEELLDRLHQLHAGDVLEFGFVHGDWAPWNMARLGRRLGVWDWERATADGPVGLDVVHFHFQQHFHRADKDVRSALERAASSIADDHDRVGVDPGASALVTTLYLVELLLRYAESGLAADPEMRRTAADLVVEIARRIDGTDPTHAARTDPAARRRPPAFGRRMLGGSGVPAPVRAAVKTGARVYGHSTASRRVVPNTFIVGAQRAGTTSLFRYLTQHPAVTGPMLEKGVHYFDTNYSMSLEWYRSHFPTARAARLARQRNGCDLRVVEACPYYLFHPFVPERIASVRDDVRIIALVRDPVGRALSHHNHEVTRGFETEDFVTALDLEKERLDGTEDDLAADPHHVSFEHQHHSYVARGHYEEQLVRYDELFGPDQVLVLRTIDLERDPAATVATALDFLGVPLAARFRFPRFNARAYDAMDPDVAARLRAEFAPTDAYIGDRLGLDRPWE